MDVDRKEGHDATDELRLFGAESLQKVLDAAVDYRGVVPESGTPKSKKASEPAYAAHFEGLVDLVEREGEVLFMVCDDDGHIEFVSEIETPSGDAVVPPPKGQLPFVLPRANELEAMRVAQLPLPVQLQAQLLFDDIVTCLRATAELPRDEHYILLAAWIMHTYLIGAFQYTPIVCLFAVPERGKTRTGKILTYLSYRGLHVESLREAYILRVAENLKAMLFIDVTDLWRKAEKNGSEDVILQRFEKGVKVARVNNPERGAFKDIVYYDIFGPTVIGTNEALDKILDTRSITINMPDSTRRFEQDVTPEAALPLRERLLLFKAHHMGRPVPHAEKPATGRLGDILRPLLQIIRLAHPEQEAAFMKLVKVIEEERTADKADSLEAEVLRGVQDCEHDVEQGMLRIGQIVKAVNSARSERYQITPQRVGKRLSAMGFSKGKLGKDRAVIWNGELIDRLIASYGLSAETSHTSHMS